MKKTLLILGFILVFIAAFIWSLPDSIDDDLSKLGNGKKSVVFVYDLNRVVSNQQTIEINKAKEQTEEEVNFLVARMGYPATDDFQRNYKAESAELLFFDETGALFERRFALVNAESLLSVLLITD
ncbi:hypothetical protein [Glaciecola sp. KUL10]|uniref:hypothetical protein n=1 Tax=Glaciecola sp. (strain KUL10) TaxID=2161813 RepID=UPI000D788FF8|nr:hypothetical protein [Glaciecola sp. KUL10]GBL04479.1 hypothetical protein KUL10_17850 [Glaciecola sp. KUL10]